MNFRVDKLEQIILAQTYVRMGKYFTQVLNNNGAAEQFLACVGLSELYSQYENIMKPYYYNGTYQNDDLQFNPDYAFFQICKEIESSREVMGKFLKGFFEGITHIEPDDFAFISSNLNLIGYSVREVIAPAPHFSSSPPKILGYELISMTEGAAQRSTDTSGLMRKLNSLAPQLAQTYKSAMDDYTNSDYSACASTCRNLLESVLSQYNSDKYAAILQITQEQIYDSATNTQLTARNKIFNAWLANPQTAGDRFRLIAMLYSFLSGVGTHSTSPVAQKDALLALRTTEDVLIFILLT